MHKFPVISGKEAAKALNKAGFECISQRGSHLKLRRITVGGKQTVIVPLRQIIRTGTMKSILRQAHMNIEELEDLL